jgi:alpha-glucosidase (family GH31 glycosyl hydrolase)
MVCITTLYVVQYSIMERKWTVFKVHFVSSLVILRHLYVSVISFYKDYFFISGGEGDSCVGNVLENYARIIGRPALPPKWSFGYLASSMVYSSLFLFYRGMRKIKTHKIY